MDTSVDILEAISETILNVPKSCKGLVKLGFSEEEMLEIIESLEF